MGFQKGNKLGQGRPKGAPNKRTSILEICESIGLNPFLKMAEMAAAGDAMMLRELCQYIEPKRKALEHSGKDGEDMGIKIIIEDYAVKK